MIHVHKQQPEISEQKDADKHKRSLFGMLRKIDDSQINIDRHYKELIKLQRESFDAIGTDRHEEIKKALVAKEAQFYNGLADQHERFAKNARVFSYIDGAVTGIDAGLSIFYFASGSNPISFAITGAISVFAAGVAVLSVRSKNRNEELAIARRKKAKSLEEEAYSAEAVQGNMPY